MAIEWVPQNASLPAALPQASLKQRQHEVRPRSDEGGKRRKARISPGTSGPWVLDRKVLPSLFQTSDLLDTLAGWLT